MDQPQSAATRVGASSRACSFATSRLIIDPTRKARIKRIGRLGGELVDVEPALRMRQLERAGRQLEHGAAQGLDLGPLVHQAAARVGHEP